MQMLEMQNCKNCRHYVIDFTINSNYLEIEGRCTNPKLNRKIVQYKFRLYENCIHWNKDVKKATPINRIIDTIKKLEDDWANLTTLLNTDE